MLRRRRNTGAGLTYVELMVSLLFFAIAAGTFTTGLSYTLNRIGYAKRRTQALNLLASQIMEQRGKATQGTVNASNNSDSTVQDGTKFTYTKTITAYSGYTNLYVVVYSVTWADPFLGNETISTTSYVRSPSG